MALHAWFTHGAPTAGALTAAAPPLHQAKPNPNELEELFRASLSAKNEELQHSNAKLHALRCVPVLCACVIARARACVQRSSECDTCVCARVPATTSACTKCTDTRMPSNRRELTAEMTHVSTLNAQLASAQDELLAKDAQLQQASFFLFYVIFITYYGEYLQDELLAKASLFPFLFCYPVMNEKCLFLM